MPVRMRSVPGQKRICQSRVAPLAAAGGDDGGDGAAAAWVSVFPVSCRNCAKISAAAATLAGPADGLVQHRFDLIERR